MGVGVWGTAHRNHRCPTSYVCAMQGTRHFQLVLLVVHKSKIQKKKCEKANMGRIHYEHETY